jgi:hypothetical protein
MNPRKWGRLAPLWLLRHSEKKNMQITEVFMLHDTVREFPCDILMSSAEA